MIVLFAIAFLIELVAFFSFAAMAFMLNIHASLQIIAYIVLLVMVIVFWGMFMSPRAPKKLQTRKYYFSKSALYLMAAFVLFNLANPTIGVLFIAVWLIDDLLLYRLQTDRISGTTQARHKNVQE